MSDSETMTMTYIVNVSGGLASYEALRRTLERYGRDATIAVFADTRVEDDDLYRFLGDIEQHLGIEIVRLADGRTPWEVIHDERYITMRNRAPCSAILKHEVIDRWVNENFGAKPKTLVFGFDWTEPQRVERIAKRMAPVPVWCPLLERPLMTKQEIARAVEAIGIEIPLMYRQGFEHNNCGQIGCVRAGISHFVHLYHVRPAVYAKSQRSEQGVRDYLGKNVSILRDRRGGRAKPLTLAALAARIEAKEQFQDDLWGGCGCFIE